MNAFDTFLSCSGNWQGNSRLHYPPSEPPKDTPSALSVMRRTGDETVQCSYTWSYQNEPQHGTLALQKEPSGQVTADWKDSWHTGGQTMRLKEDSGYGSSLLGAYAAPPGPDWGWRIIVEGGGEPRSEPLCLRMLNITPQGEEAIAVEAEYTRSSGGETSP